LKTNFKSKLEHFESNLWSYHIKVPDSIAKKYIEGSFRRVVCKLNNKVTIYCALMPHPEGWYIMMNKANRNKLKLTLGDEIDIELQKDNSKFGMPMPEELEMSLDMDPEVKQYFEDQTPGKQRSLIHLVRKIKSSNIRLNRSMAIIEHLKRTKGQLDYKMLNETIKEFNQRNKLI